MVVSVTIAKVLGLVYIFPLTHLIGDVGIGIYGYAYNLYAILLTLSTSGFPTAMGKLISERLALHKHVDVEQIYRVTMRTLLWLGVLFALLMWFGAPLYSRVVALKDPQQSAQYLVWSVRALAPSLLLLPLVSGLRGYLQGFQRLEPSAYSQALEQLIRVIAIIAGAWLTIRVMHHADVPMRQARGAAAATFAAFPGLVAALGVLLAAALPLRRAFTERLQRKRPALSNRAALRALYRVALPVSLGNLVIPISGFMDSLTVQNFLMFSGVSLHDAFAAYGILSRQAMQLIQLPLAFAMAIGVSVMPAIARAATLRDRRGIERSITGTIRSMFFMASPVAASLLVLATPLDLALFGETKGAIIISSVCFMSLFSSLELISTYMLQGLGMMYRPVRNMFIGIGLKLVLNVALIFPLHILGAAIATTVGYLLSSVLNIMAVKKYSKVQFSVWRLALPSLVSALLLCAVLLGARDGVYAISGPQTALGAMLQTWAQGLGGRDSHLYPVLVAWLQVLVAIFVGGIAYVLMAMRFRAVAPEELQRLPLVGRRLSRIAGFVRPGTVHR